MEEQDESLCDIAKRERVEKVRRLKLEADQAKERAEAKAKQKEST